jgi:hypothetical protein
MRSFCVALVLLSACATPDDVSSTAAVSADPIAACPVPDGPASIPGHAANFYQCADRGADFGMGCGPDGYLLGYGARYAQRFYDQTRPRMSARGQRWIDDVLLCLQRDLRDSIDESTSCDDIRTIAFDLHPGCYVDAGFCTLPLTDILQVAWTIDLRDWASGDSLRQVVHTAASCSRQYALALRWLFPSQF